MFSFVVLLVLSFGTKMLLYAMFVLFIKGQFKA